MSSDTTSYAVLGVEADPSGFRTRVKAFAHDYTEDYQFCPKTGKALWREATDLHAIAAGSGLAVVTIDQEGASPVYVGVVLANTRYDTNAARGDADPTRLLSLIEQTRRKLAGIGLLDERKFGLWAVTHYSY